MMRCSCGSLVGRNMVDGVHVCDRCFQVHCIELQLRQVEEDAMWDRLNDLVEEGDSGNA